MVPLALLLQTASRLNQPGRTLSLSATQARTDSGMSTDDGMPERRNNPLPSSRPGHPDGRLRTALMFSLVRSGAEIHLTLNPPSPVTDSVAPP